MAQLVGRGVASDTRIESSHRQILLKLHCKDENNEKRGQEGPIIRQL